MSAQAEQPWRLTESEWLAVKIEVQSHSKVLSTIKRVVWVILTSVLGLGVQSAYYFFLIGLGQ